MTEPEQQMTIEMEPVSVPDEWIIDSTFKEPAAPVTTPSDYDNLIPITVEMAPLPTPQPTPEKELVINIETTDVDPWNGRIVSIAYVDTSQAQPEAVVMFDEDEEALVNDFLDWFDTQDFTRLVGFKISFDHRFLFSRALYYRRKAPKWANIAQRDIKQILDQVQEGFVYFPSKTGTLDDWGKYLLGYGKLAEQEEFLKRFLAKDYDFVVEFSRRQVVLTNDLYALIRYVLNETDWAVSYLGTEQGSESVLTESGEVISIPQKQCPVCYAYNPQTAATCQICGAVFE